MEHMNKKWRIIMFLYNLIKESLPKPGETAVIYATSAHSREIKNFRYTFLNKAVRQKNNIGILYNDVRKKELKLFF